MELIDKAQSESNDSNNEGISFSSSDSSVGHENENPSSLFEHQSPPLVSIVMNSPSNNSKAPIHNTDAVVATTPRKLNKYDVSTTMTRLRDSMVGTSHTTHTSADNSGAPTEPTTTSGIGKSIMCSKESTSLKRSHGLDDYFNTDEEFQSLLGTQQRDQIHADQSNKGDTTNHIPKQFVDYNDDDDDDGDCSDNIRRKFGQKNKHIYVHYDTFQADSTQLNERNKKMTTKKENEEEDYVIKKKDIFHSDIPTSKKILNGFHQIPAVALIGMFHLMIGIPFGVSYFPIGWKESSEYYDTSSSLNSTQPSADYLPGSGGIDGPFPVEGKNALGIRMFLFSTIMGQIVFTFKSGFKNPIGLNMVENVPFCQALATITIEHCGYGMEALSTLFVMFGISSMIVGLVFYILGKFELGRIIYFFPSHVLVGLIAGIGIFIGKTGIEVAMNAVFSLENIFSNSNLLLVVLAFEVVLRLLERLNVKYGKNGNPVFSLLSPIYFCSITPIFYGLLWLMGISVADAEQEGFFFPSLVGNDCESNSSAIGCSDMVGSEGTAAFMSFLKDTIFNKDVFDIWRVIDFTTVSWAAIRDSIPTLSALTIFSLIHVPINIPAFAISTNSEYDMNRELIAHGYSNCLSGMFGGLQNYMAYTQSILYDRSGGYGKPSGIAVAVVTSILYFFGPSIASTIPRCMAGTLLVHVGIDLFLEGVFDTLGKFEQLEYAGIWLIAVVMTFAGMDAAMIAGECFSTRAYFSIS